MDFSKFVELVDAVVSNPFLDWFFAYREEELVMCINSVEKIYDFKGELVEVVASVNIYSSDGRMKSQVASVHKYNPYRRTEFVSDLIVPVEDEVYEQFYQAWANAPQDEEAVAARLAMVAVHRIVMSLKAYD